MAIHVPHSAALKPTNASSTRRRSALPKTARESRSHILVEPSLSVNRKVTVPVGGPSITSPSSSLPLGNNIAAEHCRGPPFTRLGESASQPSLRSRVRVTDGARTRVLRSHNPSKHIRVCPTASQYVA